MDHWQVPLRNFNFWFTWHSGRLLGISCVQGAVVANYPWDGSTDQG